jgi:hypothetical protein
VPASGRGRTSPRSSRRRRGREAARLDSPHDQLQAILRSADELAGPLRPLGAEAAAAARQLIAALEHADREIALLTHNLEPGERERLSDKIQALTGDEAAPMRHLLEKQLELIPAWRRASSRPGPVGPRVELLKTLALHVASLRTRAPSRPRGALRQRARARVVRRDLAPGAAAGRPGRHRRRRHDARSQGLTAGARRHIVCRYRSPIWAGRRSCCAAL